MRELKTYKQRVGEILRLSVDSRNDDGVLFAHYINKYHPELITESIYDQKCIELRNFTNLPPMENIRRSRQLIQNGDNQYLPTDEEVREARGIKEKNWTNVEVREAKQTKLL